MDDFIISHFSFELITSSVTLPVHEPISFGFEDMVKAKAEADAAVSAEIARQLIGKACGNGRVYKDVSYYGSGSSSSEALTDTARSEYIYDYNLAAELSEIKRRKNRR